MSEPSTSRRARILLIEDDPGDQELTRRALLRDGILADVEVLADGEQALDHLLRRGAHAGSETPRPDLILLDLNLPKVPGRQVLEEVRKHPELRHTPIVVVSTSARHRDIQDSYALGCNSYLVKPLEAHRYMKALQELYAYWFETVALPTP